MPPAAAPAAPANNNSPIPPAVAACSVVLPRWEKEVKAWVDLISYLAARGIAYPSAPKEADERFKALRRLSEEWKQKMLSSSRKEPPPPSLPQLLQACEC